MDLVSHVNTAQEITFDAVDLEIVRIQSKSGDITTSYDGHKLTIRWAQSIVKNESATVQIDYQIHAPIGFIVILVVQPLKCQIVESGWQRIIETARASLLAFLY